MFSYYYYDYYFNQVQAEVKKAWLRRSLVLDLKQKARMTSSGGGSCYYGGMMSHATTHSVCMSAVHPRAFSFTGGTAGPGAGGSEVRLPRHSAPSFLYHNHSSLCVFVPSTAGASGPQQDPAVGNPGRPESGLFARHTRASKGNDNCSSHATEDPACSSCVKEVETIM